MKKKWGILLVVCCLLLGTSFAFAQVESEKFIYDAQGKRDPFVSLYERETEQIREDFTPPGIELPFPIELKGILWSGNQFFAIINGKVMKSGENIGAVKIKKIEKDKVVLTYGERNYSVFLRRETEK